LGLGLFKIERTYDPNHLSRVPDMNVVWAIKFCLVCSLFLFGIGLWLGISPTKRSKRADEEDAVFAADLLHFSEEIIASPITDTKRIKKPKRDA